MKIAETRPPLIFQNLIPLRHKVAGVLQRPCTSLAWAQHSPPKQGRRGLAAALHASCMRVARVEQAARAFGEVGVEFASPSGGVDHGFSNIS